MTACGSEARNAEIARQRLDPADVVALDPPDCSDDGATGLSEALADVEASGGEEAVVKGAACGGAPTDDRLFAACIDGRRDFHVDPYGGMSFCGFVKDPELRYDLRAGTVRGGWEEFIPSLADRVRGGEEYLEGCAACDLRGDCRWCGVYGALEHGRLGARVDYLCDVARASRAYADDWAANHTRYFEIAGITVKVESDLPITDSTFEHEVRAVPRRRSRRRHDLDPPSLSAADARDWATLATWSTARRRGSSTAKGLLDLRIDGRRAGGSEDVDQRLRLAVFNEDHTRGRIYNYESQERVWRKEAWRP